VRIDQAELLPYRLPLKRPWRTRRGQWLERRGWLVCLRADGGEGLGDCAPLPEAGTETYAEAHSWLSEHLTTLSRREPDELLQELAIGPSAFPAARCALETALLHLLARTAGKTVARMLNPAAASRVRVNANLGALSDRTSQRLGEAKGYTVIKVKLGCAPPAQEIEWLHRLAEALPPAGRLRLDANRAWSLHDAEHLLRAIDGLPIESLEEPLAHPDPAALRALQEGTSIPLALDESLSTLIIGELLQSAPVRRIVIKPMVQGGLRAGLSLARRAHHAGIETVVTTTVDSAIGVRAAVHLAAALGDDASHLAHGLATGDWLVQDVAEPPRIVDGIIDLDSGKQPA